MDHQARIKIAETLKRKILKKYKSRVLGIVIYGSVAKNEDGHYSDLEMYVVTKKKLKVSEVRYVYKGMTVEVSYIPERKMLSGAREITPNWPIEADFYRSYLILHEKNEWFKKLQKAISSQNPKDFKKAMKKMLVWLNELMGKIKNAYLYKNNHLFLWLTSFLGWESIIFLGLANRKYFKSERYIFKTVKKFPILPKNYPYLLETVCHFSVRDRHRVYHAALKLFAELNAIACRQKIVLGNNKLFV